MNKKLLFLALGTILVAATVFGIFSYQYSTRQGANLSRMCPEQWYDDRMPGPDRHKTQSQYLIVNGECREIKDYDLNWIKANCPVNKPSIVY